ncbi:FAD:protein FMN transferase [Treponema sp. Marseille-Q4130]|uniref:FAD:protein FMN transferase n=1 Tax=Treponema sp. Marseille-Q4130 TaxID=2766702 RepID=UPI001652A57A|nr:FAD:protein FMN transferase [Treponema sp. Marseille-Q4130]MBC6719073.1 FAD:protein FMN transferase [Treponema sp. Marseille-Q4130]
MKNVFDFNKIGENRALIKRCFGVPLFRQYFQKAIFALLIIIFSTCFTSCERSEGPRTEALMGTVCTVNAYDDGTKSLYDELFARLHEIDETFSVTIESSEISAINKAAGERSVSVSSDTAYVVKAALSYAELTDGAFDPTVGPLVKIWGINTDHARVPAQSEIDAVLPLINWRDVSAADDNTVMLKRRGMALDLGGIVKGYAADELTKILKARKVRRAIVDLGGNIFVYGKKKDGSPWRVGIKDPNDPEGVPAIVLNVANSTIVTSGVYERFFTENGVRYHHILDAKTGYPASSGLLSSTIVCESSMAADALSTSVFVLGKESGMELLHRIQSSAGTPLAEIPGLHAQVLGIFIEEDGSVSASKALEGSLEAAAVTFE